MRQMRIKMNLLRCPGCFLLFFFLTAFSGAVFSAEANKTETLVTLQEAVEDFEVDSFTSTAEDAVGHAGLWGMRIQMVVPHTPEQVYASLSDMQAYPLYMHKVKKNQIIKTLQQGVITDYIEMGLGLEFSSTLQWQFDSEKLFIISRSIGEDDDITYMEFRVHPTALKNFSRVEILTYTQVSWVPDFVLNWVAPIGADLIVKSYRQLFTGRLSEEKQQP